MSLKPDVFRSFDREMWSEHQTDHGTPKTKSTRPFPEISKMDLREKRDEQNRLFKDVEKFLATWLAKINSNKGYYKSRYPT